MTIKQQGGIFGRNPTFNEVDIEGTLSAETVDINGGTIDGTAIGGTTPAAIIGTAMEASSLGIGTTPSGGVKLDVVGTLRSTISGGTPALYLNNGTTQNSITNTSGSFSFSTGAVERLRIDTSNVTVSTGNLVIGTSGKGIDFSVTSGTGTSELFDDYEEGNCTLTLKGSTTDPTTPATTTGSYTKIGNLVHVSARWQGVNVTGAAGNISIDGLPYASVVYSAGSLYGSRASSSDIVIATSPSSSSLNVYDAGGNLVTWSSTGNVYWLIGISYKV